MMSTLYNYFLDILALNFPHSIERMIKKEFPLHNQKTLQQKIKLIRVPDGVMEDRYIGDDDVDLDTGELKEANLYLDRGNSNEKGIIVLDLPKVEDWYTDEK